MKGATEWVSSGGKSCPQVRSGSSINTDGVRAGLALAESLPGFGEFLSLSFHILHWDICGNRSWLKGSPLSFCRELILLGIDEGGQTPHISTAHFQNAPVASQGKDP